MFHSASLTVLYSLLLSVSAMMLHSFLLSISYYIINYVIQFIAIFHTESLNVLHSLLDVDYVTIFVMHITWSFIKANQEIKQLDLCIFLVILPEYIAELSRNVEE